MALNIVLVEPVIPQNTGNIARLSAANEANLHLIKPLGFELSDRYLKRAGLDYWSEVKLTVHENWDSFLSDTNCSSSNLWIISTKATKSYCSANFSDGDFLVFGNEIKGLDPIFHEKYSDRRLLIPMKNENIRSLNLANSVAIVLYEAVRQLRTDLGRENTLFVHLTYVPYIAAAGELKTKPTQHSVKDLLQIGIQPDILLCRTDRFLADEIKKKIALFCNLRIEAVITAKDVDNIYEIPLILFKEKLDQIIIESLKMWTRKPDISNWEKVVEKSPCDQARWLSWLRCEI